MACWDGELILLWRYEGVANQDVRLQMTFIGDDLYESCRQFLDDVQHEAEGFPGAHPQISPGNITSASREEDL